MKYMILATWNNADGHSDGTFLDLEGNEYDNEDEIIDAMEKDPDLFERDVDEAITAYCREKNYFYERVEPRSKNTDYLVYLYKIDENANILAHYYKGEWRNAQ